MSEPSWSIDKPTRSPLDHYDAHDYICRVPRVVKAEATRQRMCITRGYHGIPIDPFPYKYVSLSSSWVIHLDDGSSFGCDSKDLELFFTTPPDLPLLQPPSYSPLLGYYNPDYVFFVITFPPIFSKSTAWLLRPAPGCVFSTKTEEITHIEHCPEAI